jgi:hypothetical protein
VGELVADGKVVSEGADVGDWLGGATDVAETLGDWLAGAAVGAEHAEMAMTTRTSGRLEGFT